MDRGRHASRSAGSTGFCAGMATMPRGGRSITIGHACGPAWRARLSCCAERVERSFALILDRGGMRRTWLRRRENIHKRYLIHVAGYNLGLIMRLLTGAGTPRELHARASTCLFALITSDAALLVIIVIAQTTTWQSPSSLSRQTRPTELWLSQRAVKGAMVSRVM